MKTNITYLSYLGERTKRRIKFIPILFLVLQKKVALVTGANRGIGKEVVRQLATLGYQVFLGSRDETKGQKTVDELHAAGLTDVHLLVLDVSNDESTAAAAESLAKKVSVLDVLVNNAGILNSGTNPIKDSIANIEKTYATNVFGVIRSTTAFLDLLKKSKSGRVVNVTSWLGSLTLNSDKSSPIYNYNALGYNSSKAALNMVTVSFSKALAEFNIKVNAACPGVTATDMNGGSYGHPVDVGAISIVKLATLPDDGPTGAYFNKDGPLPW